MSEYLRGPIMYPGPIKSEEEYERFRRAAARQVRRLTQIIELLSDAVTDTDWERIAKFAPEAMGDADLLRALARKLDEYGGEEER